MHESGSGLRLKRQRHMRRAAPDSASRRLDWESMRKQIVASQASLLALDDDTPEALAQLWQQRAAQLAQLPEPEATGEQLSLIVIRLGRERYGLEVPYVRDAASARAL